MTFATGLWMLIAGRFVIGVATGTTAIIVTVYLAEVSPSRVRGRLVGSLILFLAGGVLTAYCMAYYVGSNWRYMFCASVVPAVV